MGLKPIHLTILIVWAVVVWDQAPLVETANQRDKNVSLASLRLRLPPGIVVPLPYVYPEYVDPREPTNTPTTLDNRPAKTSVSDVILEDVTKTMHETMTEENVAPFVRTDGNNAVKSVVKENDEAMATLIAMSKSNNRSVEETKRRPSGNRPIRFGARLRTSAAQSAKQDFLDTTSSTTENPDTKNEKITRSQSSSIRKIAPRKILTNATRNNDDVLVEKRLVAKVRKVATRRRRPNAENFKSVRRPVKVKNTESEFEAKLEKPEPEAAPAK